MFKNKVILILGAGQEQLPAYQICKTNSAIIIGVDKNKHAPGLKLSDYKIITSIRNDKKLIIKIKKLNLKISAVLMIANDIPKIYYNICKELRTKNISRKAAELSSNKIKFDKEFKKNNISIPNFCVIKNIRKAKNFFETNNLPFVLKPYDSRGARGVNFIDKNSNFEKLFRDSLKVTKDKKLILQKFINGTQVSSESIKYKNKIYTIMSYRNYKDVRKFYPSIIENGGDIPLKIDKKIKKKIDLLIFKISKILNIKDSPLKCDLVISKDKIYVLEATPRFGGGYLASHSSEILYGVNFLLLYIKILLGFKIEKINFIYQKKFLNLRFFFAKKTGIIKSIKIPNLAKYKKYIVHKVFTKKVSSSNNIVLCFFLITLNILWSCLLSLK